MRVLRARHGFQADHSSSSYLFYAADRPVGAAGQQVARRYSSRAEVDEQTARYLKWGESSLSHEAYRALLSEHYDVMASESYDWWSLMIALPKTPQVGAALDPFVGMEIDEVGLEVLDYKTRWVVHVGCMFDYEGPVFGYDSDNLEDLVERLVVIREEILRGNASFLRAVAETYDLFAGGEAEGGERPAGTPGRPEPPREDMTKAELQRECEARGIPYRKSWTKERLRAALTGPAPGPPARGLRLHRPPRSALSRAAQDIVDSLSSP